MSKASKKQTIFTESPSAQNNHQCFSLSTSTNKDRTLKEKDHSQLTLKHPQTNKAYSTTKIIDSAHDFPKCSTPIQIKNSIQDETRVLTVKEIDIKTLFKEFQNVPSVGFAHCISGDFCSPGHMSRGVAVAFKEMFGQTKASDLVESQLVLQTPNVDTSVFGLVTKPKYHMKPMETD